jgi:hypothetical protein
MTLGLELHLGFYRLYNIPLHNGGLVPGSRNCRKGQGELVSEMVVGLTTTSLSFKLTCSPPQCNHFHSGTNRILPKRSLLDSSSCSW